MSLTNSDSKKDKKEWKLEKGFPFKNLVSFLLHLPMDS